MIHRISGKPPVPESKFMKAQREARVTQPTTCARYFGSDGTLCSTHNGRFLSDTSMRCQRREAIDAGEARVTQPTTDRIAELRRLMVNASDTTEAQMLGWLAEFEDRVRADRPPEPPTRFYDGAHDDCKVTYRHNHSTAELRQVLSPGELAIVNAIVRRADRPPEPPTPHRFDHDGTHRHHHDADTGEPWWWQNVDEWGGDKRPHRHVASPPPPELSELRALSEAASPGPWRVGSDGYGIDAADGGIRLTADSEFIVAMERYVRSLLASQPPSTPRETTP